MIDNIIVASAVLKQTWDAQSQIITSYGPSFYKLLCLSCRYCWGDADTTWGAVRTYNDSHPAYYNLTIIELGNEQWNPDYVTQVAAMETRAKTLKSAPKIKYMFPVNGGFNTQFASQLFAIGGDELLRREWFCLRLNYLNDRASYSSSLLSAICLSSSATALAHPCFVAHLLASLQAPCRTATWVREAAWTVLRRTSQPWGHSTTSASSTQR